jgi:asparagine synthase (glutamine-hydrolysing)
LILACNGEIYNYPSLRRTLETAGHVFSSHSDSEVLLHAFEEWGEAMLNRLQGMFAFILWNERTGRVFAARDHMGIKPLAYRVSDGKLTIASDTRAIRRLYPQLPVDRLALCYMLSLGYIPAPLSIWEGVQKLEPGCWLSFRDGRVETGRYWEPPRSLDKHYSGHDFGSLFDTVASEHLMADVPVGLFLSGGLDSSAVAVACVRKDTRPNAFTISFPDSPNDEAPIARQVATTLGLQHEVRSLFSVDVLALLNETVRAFDEPQGYSALLTMQRVCKVAAESFKVVLSGDGGDEVFAGYRWYDAARHRPSPEHFRLRRWWNKLGGREKPAGSWMEFSRISPLHAHAARLFPRFLPHEANRLVRPRQEFDAKAMLAPLHKHYDPSLPIVRALQRVDLMTFCSNSILSKVDRASMDASLEVRVPFLDRRLIEYGLSLPEAECPEPKAPVRAYLVAQGIPNAVLEHPKQGFSLRDMQSMDWNSVIAELQDGYLVASDILAPEAAAIAAKSPRPGGRLWTLLALEYWARTWIG